jgi:hypothetical protein
MKLTQSKKVWEIVRPPIDGMPTGLTVGMSDSVMRAVELMLKNDLTAIAVISGGRFVGHVRLAEALKYLGVRMPSPCPPAGSGSDRNGFH